MGLLELFVLAGGLSIDSFAVSVCTGVVNQKIKFTEALKMAFVLALIQGLAPVIGGLLGLTVKSMVENLDHWISLVLLILVGGKMIYDGLYPGKSALKGKVLKMGTIMTMGVATSIDALVVGVTLGLIGVNLFQAGVVIGSVTFLAVMIGLLVGSRILGFSRTRLEIVAGVFLIGIGIKIFVEHTLAGI